MTRSKKPTIEDDKSNLPCEIIEAILARLPVKSLLRFQSVSKPWNSLISNYNFAKSHLNQSKNSDETLFLSVSTKTNPKFCFLKFENQTVQIGVELEFPYEKYRKASLLCAYDGLVLLKNRQPRDGLYVLWNPSRRTCAEFSCPYKIELAFATHGLCYDPSNDDYKVLLVTEDFYAVFSYKNNCWTKETWMMHTKVFVFQSRPGLTVDGCPHWVRKKRRTSDGGNTEEILFSEFPQHVLIDGPFSSSNFPVYKCDDRFSYEIIRFDPRDDKFGLLCKPKCFEESAVFNITCLRGCFCLYRNTCDMKIIEIWMMKEYGNGDSWMKFMTIENVPSESHLNGYSRLLGLTSNGEVVFWISPGGFVVYDPMQNKFGETQKIRGMFTVNLLDSLLFPIRNTRLRIKSTELCNAQD